MNTGISSSLAGRFRLAALTLAIALPALVNAATDTPEGSPQATSASVYADAIGSSRFERSGLRVEQGYTVESGNLYTRDGKDGKTGSLVVVRSPDGAVTALVDNPGGKRGLLLVDAQGKSTFKEDLPYDYMTPDTVESADSAEVSTPAVSDAQPGAMRYIDMLVAYSTATLGHIFDPVMNALAQLETANLGLRNSRVEDLELRLAAVNIFDVNHDTSSQGLANWQSMLHSWRSLYRADVNAAFTVGGDAGGRAYMPGYTSVNDIRYSGGAFRHEIGHNAGGNHCNDGSASYKFGYESDTSTTYLCGNMSPYYSTPAVNDASGNPLGNAQTADMARVWRENASDMVNYNTALPSPNMVFVSPPGRGYKAETKYFSVPQGAEVGFVALNPYNGPTQLVPYDPYTLTRVNVIMRNTVGNEFTIAFTAKRLRSAACSSQMNAYSGCTEDNRVGLQFSYLPGSQENVSLPPGIYNGALELEARDRGGSWRQKFIVALSVAK
ncbi:hypothetical protein J3P85_10835 [Pseudomonas sp. Z1-12]|uniref:hypothetical protein n=1 Tax=Pseudomonas sp. Z1-12 TaxID=2817408 RepID=UPI003DA9C969